MKTTAAVVESQGEPFTFTEVELDGPREDEVLVRVVATGLCHTDITMGSFLPTEMFPHVFGHEGTGVVEEVGAAVTSVEVGDHVVISFRSCRACAKCEAGLVGYCDSTLMLNYMGMRMDGSFTMTRDGSPVFGSFFGQSSLAEHAIAYADNCVVVEPDLDLIALAPYGCGFQTGAGTVLNVLGPGNGDSLVVYGAGAVGLSALAAAAANGFDAMVAVDPLPERRAAAVSFGATAVDPAAAGEGDQSVVDRVKELTGGGASYGIDTTAKSEVVKQGLQSLAVRGTFVALGLGAEEYAVDAIDLLQGGKRLISSIEGDSDPQEMVPRLIAMHRDGRFPVDDLVTTYPVTQISAAVDDVTNGKVVKPVLVW